MKHVLSLAVLLSAVFVTLLQAQTQQAKGTYQNATVLSVDKYTAPSNDAGTTPTDAPLQPQAYTYDVSVRVNCNVYVGRYESAIDYLPSVLAANKAVDVRVDKHRIYINLPGSDRTVEMGIVSHKRAEQGCSTNS